MTQVEFRDYVRTENIEMVKKGLASKNIDPNKPNKQSDNALDIATNIAGFKNKMTPANLEIIKLLLDAGVTPKYNNFTTVTLYGHLEALKLFTEYSERTLSSSDLSSCVNNGHVETVRFILNNPIGYDTSNMQLLGIIKNKIRFMSIDMFELLFSHLTQPEADNNQYMLECANSLNKNIELILKIIRNDMRVTSVAIELGQTDLLPNSVTDIFLF